MKLTPGQVKKVQTYQESLTHPFNPNYIGKDKQFVKPYGKLKAYKKGGKVKKTGPAKLHKGERVLTKKQTKKFDAKKFNKARMAYAKGN